MKVISKVFKTLLVLIVIMMMGVGVWIVVTDWLLPVLAVKQFKGENKVPHFTEVVSGFNHIYTEKDTFPMVDVVAFDRTGNGRIELLVTGAAGQDNALISYQDGIMVDNISGSGLSQVTEATYGLEAVDIDADGDIDIITAQQNGVFLYTNTNGVFTVKEIPLAFEEDVVAFDVSAGDVHNSGYPDLYISTFKDKTLFKQAIFNDESNKSANIYLHNNGDGTFVDQTDPTGLTYRQNTFLARFADLNEDGFTDLIVSPNTDRARIYENNTNGTFTEHTVTDYGFWMGIATGDIDNDGDLDIFLSNLGNTVPTFMIRGDSTDEQPIDKSWRMLRNDGNFVFTDVTEETNTGANIFAWGTEFADFNNDGREDLVVTENYIALPMLMHKYYRNPGKLYIQGVDGVFVHTERESGVSNRFFGYTPLPVDLDGDDFMDLVIVNQNGPLRVFRNDGE